MANKLPPLRLNRSYEYRASEAAVSASFGPSVARAGLSGLPMAPLPSAAPRQAPRTRSGAESVLELRHPDMARAISLLWGHPEMDQYFERLWLADGNHAPIDPESMSELMLLSQLHNAIRPRRPERSLASMYNNGVASAPKVPERVRATAMAGPSTISGLTGNDLWSEVPLRR